jgi:hypothetical protein
MNAPRPRNGEPPGDKPSVGGGSLIGPMGRMLEAMVVSKFVRHQRLVVLMVTPNRASLARLRELIERGKVTPIFDRTYPLHRTPDAIRYGSGARPCEDRHQRVQFGWLIDAPRAGPSVRCAQ